MSSNLLSKMLSVVLVFMVSTELCFGAGAGKMGTVKAAPASAASGFPVMAIQFLPCSGGFWVRAVATMERMDAVIQKKKIFMLAVFID